MTDVKSKTFHFDVQETTVRSAVVEATSLVAARSMMRDYVAGNGGADMGGDAPIQLGDLESVKMTFRCVSASTR